MFKSDGNRDDCVKLTDNLIVGEDLLLWFIHQTLTTSMLVKTLFMSYTYIKNLQDNLTVGRSSYLARQDKHHRV